MNPINNSALRDATALSVADIDCPGKVQPFGTKAKQFTSTERDYINKVQ